ncbi:hypothetical protein CYMTET_14555 [Cymbomonas tetramitiformis]|uniref:Band 7 domain-containing protein n=1 Tax=Cymbomonas tetramitiformis TaxID=36881 RepID=A0AAE0GG25_9CHLO|nr:hypothetical protein CYMTET_14555 [Cymbomonas tetramitiformis]|eukprot:gene17161-20409_t
MTEENYDVKPLLDAMRSGPPAASKAGLSGEELIKSFPDPFLENYITRFDANDLQGTFTSVGIRIKHPSSSCLGVGHVVNPGGVDMAMRDGELYAMLPGIHAWATCCFQLKPYEVIGTIKFEEGGIVRENGQQDFGGGVVVTVGPNEVGYVYNVPASAGGAGGTSEEADHGPVMGAGARLIPPGTWVIRAPILVARKSFEVTTSSTHATHMTPSYIQEIDLGVSNLAKPRLVYVPYNHHAMFVDGHSVRVADQGFHWANPGIEIAGPWPQHQQRFTYGIEAKTIDNMRVTVECECWMQMMYPERYVQVAGKETLPQKFLEEKLLAKVKQYVAQISALQVRPVEVEMNAGPDDAGQALNDFNDRAGAALPMAIPVEGADGPSGGSPEEEDIIVTKQDSGGPTECEVFNRMKALLGEVRGFVDSKSGQKSLASQVQDAVASAGLLLVSIAALSVNLPTEIIEQMSRANEEQIQAQTEQVTNYAKAEKHVAEKYAEIRKKAADRDEETKDAENQVTLQKTKARLYEAEEFAKRQAKRAEQKVDQSIELQALEHKLAREQTRITNDMIILEQEAELLEKQAEIETKRLSLVASTQKREKLEADIEAYKIATKAKAERENVNQQTLVEAVMSGLGEPLQGAKIININGGHAGEGKDGSQGSSFIPQIVALREILGQTDQLTVKNYTNPSSQVDY